MSTEGANQYPSNSRAPLTMRALAHGQLKCLSDAVDLGYGVAGHPLLVSMLGPLAGEPLSSQPRWESDLTDDGTPFEFSVAFGAGRRQLRYLVEAQGSTATATSTWEAGLGVNAQMGARRLADLAWFNPIESLFAPVAQTPARFLLWHGVVLGEDANHTIKAYVNPQLLGPRAARPLVMEALGRIGLADAVEFMKTAIDADASILYLSLDLLPANRARAKIYVARQEGSYRNVAAAATRGCLLHSDAVLDPLLKLTGGAPLKGRPVLSCYSFRQGQPHPELTVHVPVRCILNDDAQSLENACALLAEADQARLRRATEGLAGGSLEESRGLITYVSVRPSTHDPTVTVYLAPRAYTLVEPAPRHSEAPTPRPVGPPMASYVRELSAERVAPQGTTFAGVRACIGRQQALLRQHPFYARLDETDDVFHARLVASRIAFFVMAFQDVLRLARTGTKDPVLREIARTHQQEDAGHDHWFLWDVSVLDLNCDAHWLFSRHHEVTRDVAYELITCLMSSKSDHARLAVALSLESIGAVFFEKMICFLERLGFGEDLRYFARSHQQVEQSHEVFESSAQEKLDRIDVPVAFHDEVWEAIDRTFAGMNRINDELVSLLGQPRDSLVLPAPSGAAMARAANMEAR